MARNDQMTRSGRPRPAPGDTLTQGGVAMSRLHLVLIAERYQLDSELLVASLALDGLVETARPGDLPATDLSRVSLVLLDSECDRAPFEAACSSGSAVGLLYDADTALLRQRAAHPAVRLVAPRTSTVDGLAGQVREVLDGLDRCLLPQPRAATVVPALSPRESEVLGLMAKGLGNREIADHLEISPHTVRTHVQSVLAKFNKGNRVSAVGAARLAGLLTQ